MNKKEYKNPTTKLVKLRHQCHLLVGSGSDLYNQGEGQGGRED